jgi:poly(glycerol-phosphate) alpha-glucosyltransferase
MKGGYDLLHTHGIWQWPSAAVHGWYQNTKRPYLIAPRGMLDPWALARSTWKKWLVSHWYEAAHLRDAACLHALCASEAESMRAYGLTNPICVIPNGVELPEEIPEMLKSGKLNQEKKILLFLGRLHPKKGLMNALRAWAEVRGQRSEAGGREDWQFVVAGWDQSGHEANLKRLCDELHLTYAETPASIFTDNGQRTKDNGASVIFTGPAFGLEKDALLRRASAFILPSFSEGLPMSVLEAWSYRLPVLMTDECNLPEGFAADAAIHIGTDVTSIAEGMRGLLRSPASDLRSLGRNGRALVERQFTWPQIAAQMKDVYDWVLGIGEKPSSIGL